MAELEVIVDGTWLRFTAEQQPVTIGSHPGCSVVVDRPGVDPVHLTARCDAGTWTVHDHSGATFGASGPVSSLPVTDLTWLRLGAPDGPALHVDVTSRVAPTSSPDSTTALAAPT